MRDEVRRDLRQSARDFASVVWPVVEEHCPELQGSILRMIEGGEPTTMTQELDAWAGMDAYQRTTVGLRGIAARVQWWVDHQTFTVRRSRPNGALTEYAKRLVTIKRRHEGFLYPYWTIQAYLDQPGGRLLSVGVARTVELYLYIEQRERDGNPCRTLPAGNGGERFLVVEWDEYLATGNSLFVFPGLRKRSAPRPNAILPQQG